MKNAFKVIGGLLALSAAGRAEIQVGDGAVQLQTTLRGTYDSNLTASANGPSDYYLIFFPNLRYRLPGGRFDTEASAGVRIRRYLDRTAFDSEDADLSFKWNMLRTEGQTTGANLGLTYFENTAASPDLNAQVRSKRFSGNTSGEVLLAGRNLLKASLNYYDTKNSIGSDQTGMSERLGYDYVGFPDGTTFGVAYAHQTSNSTDQFSGVERIDQTARTLAATLTRPLYAELTGGLTYGYRWLDRGTQEKLIGLTDEHGTFYSLNLDGPFLPKKYFPKTTGTFRVGYEQASVPGLNDNSTERLVGEINVAWDAREHTKVNFFARRSQDLSINDNTVVNESTGLHLTQAIGYFVTSDFTLAYTNADFVNLGRTDDRYEARAGATYHINRKWSSGANYSFLRSKSNSAIANYDRHLVTGTVNYAF